MEWKPRHPNCLRPQPDWMMRVQVGDVIRRGDGPFRIVREVTRYGNGELRSVTLAIRRCSWTHRCYTVLSYTDLIHRGFTKVPVKPRKLTSLADRAVTAAIHQPAWEPRLLTCCDVEGVS